MAQRKITDIFLQKPRTISLEFFPPKTAKGVEHLYETAGVLAGLGADFFSVTYGAGGSTSQQTLQAVEGLLERFDVPVVHHFTCIKHTWDSLRGEIAEMKRVGLRNIMALRGDPPAAEPDYRFRPDQPRYAYQLIEMIREHAAHFAVGVAAFPEGHPLTSTLEIDSYFLRMKQDSGADFAISQFFFDNQTYYEFLYRIRKAGVTMRVIPGILPITNYENLVRFAANCRSNVPRFIHEAFAPIKDDPDATAKKGLEFAIRQCQDLLDHGAPGVHFYCLNRAEPVATIVKSLRL
jgi:methylenetetrahydrofolate reductase (NADPH)